MVFSKDGRTMALIPVQADAGDPPQFMVPTQLWIYKINEKASSMVDGEEAVSDCDINKDGKRIAIGRWDGTVTMVDREGKKIWNRRVGGGSRVLFSPDEKSLLVGTSHGKVFLFDMDGNEKWSIK